MTILDEFEKKGLDRGHMQGLTQGIHVVKLWLQNVPIPEIAESVGLSVEQVKDLIANFQSKN